MNFFRRNSDPATQLQRRLLPTIAAFLLILGVGVAGYVLIEGMSGIDALYMTVITLSTVGFSEIQPLSAVGRAFTIGLIVTGVSTLGYAAATIVEYLVGGQLAARFAQRRKEQALAALENHYIVCGYGRVGSQIAAELLAADQQLVVIDRSEVRCHLAEAAGSLYLQGDAASSQMLRGAGIERAAGVLVATGSDAENVYTVLAARALVPHVLVVARASSTEAVERLTTAGAARVFSPHAEGAQSMVSFMLRPRVANIVSELLDPGSSQLDIQESIVERDSPFAGRSLQDVQLDESHQVAVLAIVRHTELMLVPPGSTTLRPDDVVVFVGRPEDVRRFSGACVGVDGAPA